MLNAAGTPTILLVEDNPGDVRLIEEAFERSSFEASIDSVSDGDQALEYLEACNDGIEYPHLLLLDLNLPRTSGFTVLEELRDDPELSQIPVLVLTSSSTQEDIVKSYDLAANAYLTKPDGPNELVELVDTIESFWFDQVQLPPLTW